MKKIILLWVCLQACVLCLAQNDKRVYLQDDINEIKSDTSFVYAESTMKDVIEAQSGARAVLELKIYEWLRNKHPGMNADSIVMKSRKERQELLTKRGKYNRVLVYVNKHDLLPYVEKAVPLATDESFPVLEEVLVPELTPDEEAMAAIVRFDAIESYVKGLKYEGRVEAYGKYASHPEYAPCYMFVYDREGSVVAVLRQSGEGRHINLRTQKEDNVRNYKNCGAIWLQIK